MGAKPLVAAALCTLAALVALTAPSSSYNALYTTAPTATSAHSMPLTPAARVQGPRASAMVARSVNGPLYTPRDHTLQGVQGSSADWTSSGASAAREADWGLWVLHVCLTCIAAFLYSWRSQRAVAARSVADLSGVQVGAEWAMAAASGQEVPSALSRRSVLTSGGAALVMALSPVRPTKAEEATDAQPRAAKNILITGSNSGIGFDGAMKIAASGDRVYLACRTLEKAQKAKDMILNQVPTASSDDIIPLACDLASLESVRACAAQFQSLGVPLDALVLNAGVQYSGNTEVLRTKDGFEITVGTNHLGHFLLANLLLPQVEAAKEGRVVVTASEVHDPTSPGGSVGNGATLGDLSGLTSHPQGDFVMIDGGDYDADKAYKDSKLCNILFARELQRRLRERGSAVTVTTFGPGLITRTGFFRNQPPLFTAIFDFATNDLFRVAESVSGGGDCLVAMTEAPGIPGDAYYNNGLGPGFGQHTFEPTPVSAEAMDAEKGKRLWDISAKLVGL